MTERHKIAGNRCDVLNNVIDPFMELPVTFAKPLYLLKKYGLTSNTPVIFTLARLASAEQYKGYDQVIRVISRLKTKIPQIKYILSGQYDPKEKSRIEQLINDSGVNENVVLTGFIEETEIPAHFLLADLFVLPSKGEGFGIVLIEALACGMPVICGDSDGSKDAIYEGKLGKAINADDLSELENIIVTYLRRPLTQQKRQQLQHDCLVQFNEKDYRTELNKMLC